VQEPVQEGGGHGVVAEDLPPGNWKWHMFLGADLAGTCADMGSACLPGLRGGTGVC
jgi:hypothetical protein